MPFTLAIVGRPNVGKSSLFNRIAGRRIAIVHDTPGVTRDRRTADVVFDDMELRLIDTAGFEDAAPESLSGRMTVSYGPNPKFDVLVPMEMRETYASRLGEEVTTVATYADFRRFETTGRVILPK